MSTLALSSVPSLTFWLELSADDAIQVDGYTTAKPFFATNLHREGVMAVKVHWKPTMLKVLLFRRSKQTANGWGKVETEPMPYSTYAHYLDRLAQDTGLEEKLTSYCFRRGTANAVDGKSFVMVHLLD